MIEIDLVPGGDRPRRSEPLSWLRLPLPARRPSAGPSRSGWSAAVAVCGLIVAGGVAASWLRLEASERELHRRLEVAAADSGRLARLRSASDSLTDRREEIRRRLRALREVERSRFAWPRLLDELSGTLPDGAWLVAVERTSPLPRLAVRVRGMAPDPLAVARYARRLRASAAVATAEIEESGRRRVRGAAAQRFSIRVTREPPQGDWPGAPPDSTGKE